MDPMSLPIESHRAALVPRHAERHPAGAQAFVRSVPPTKQRRILSSVDVRQLSGRRIEDPDEERHESRVWLRVLADLHVESSHKVGAFEAFVDERSHHREEQCH